MTKNRMPDEAKENSAHPVQLAAQIVMKIGELWRHCKDGFDRRRIVDMAAGIGVAYGRLEMALAHERYALVDRQVRTGNRGALEERARKRRTLWTIKLGTAERTGSKLKHGEIERLACEIVDELGTKAAAERRWYERNMRQRRPR